MVGTGRANMRVCVDVLAVAATRTILLELGTTERTRSKLPGEQKKNVLNMPQGISVHVIMIAISNVVF